MRFIKIRALISGAVGAMIVLSVLFSLFMSADVYANGSLAVTLNPDQGNKVTVTANRVEHIGGLENTFNLNYDSGAKKWRSGEIPNTDDGFGGECSTNRTRFDIEVRDKDGNLLGEQSNVLICEPFPQPPVEITINVVSTGDVKEFGGIKGELWTKSLNPEEGNVRCQGHSTARVTGPTNKSVDVKSNGTFTTGKTLKPGTYTLTGFCRRNGEADVEYKIDNISVKKNQIRNLDVILASEEQGGGKPTGNKKNEIECQGGALGWIICPVITLVQGVVDFAKESIIIPFLETKPLETGDNPVHNSWRNFRNLANVLLIPVFFVIIFSQALSLNIDAYTIKKILPKLVAATIFIQFSYFIAAAMVDITNVLGNGLGQLVVGSFTGTNLGDVAAQGPSGFLQGLTVAGLVVAGLAAIFSGLVFALIIPLFLAVVAVILTLVFRQLIIILAAVLAPIAFAAWILPNTEKVFKLWWDSFLKALMMYPIIVLLFAVGAVAAQVLVGDVEFVDNEGIGAEAIRDVAALAAVIAPLALIPFTFKLGGTGLSAIAGGINKFRGVGVGKLKESREKPKPGGLRERAQRYKQRTGAGATRLGRVPGAGVIARPGIGFGKGSQSRAVMEFNASKADASKKLEEQGLMDPRLLNHFAQVGHSRSAYNNRIAQLESGGDEDKVMAQQLRSMSNYVGRSDVQAAALSKAAEFGAADEEAFTQVGEALRGNRALQASAIGEAAFKARERSLANSAWTVKPEGGVEKDPARLYDNIVKVKGSDLANQPDLGKPFEAEDEMTELQKATKHVLDGGIDAKVPGASETLKRNLQSALGPFSDASAQTKATIAKLVGQPKEPTQKVEITNPPRRPGPGTGPGRT